MPSTLAAKTANRVNQVWRAGISAEPAVKATETRLPPNPAVGQKPPHSAHGRVMHG